MLAILVANFKTLVSGLLTLALLMGAAGILRLEPSAAGKLLERTIEVASRSLAATINAIAISPVLNY